MLISYLTEVIEDDFLSSFPAWQRYIYPLFQPPFKSFMKIPGVVRSCQDDDMKEINEYHYNIKARFLFFTRYYTILKKLFKGILDSPLLVSSQ